MTFGTLKVPSERLNFKEWNECICSQWNFHLSANFLSPFQVFPHGEFLIRLGETQIRCCLLFTWSVFRMAKLPWTKNLFDFVQCLLLYHSAKSMDTFLLQSLKITNVTCTHLLQFRVLKEQINKEIKLVTRINTF